jgi:hypothetical protein
MLAKNLLGSVLCAAVPALALVAFVQLGGCSSSDIEVLECTGECECDEETNTCSCLGGTECVVEGGVGVTLTCDGNARCDLACGEECHVDCHGTTGCDATLGDNSTAACSGTVDCNYTCLGDCVVDCPGTSRCTVACADGATCEVTSCPSVTDCGEGMQTRRPNFPE